MTDVDPRRDGPLVVAPRRRPVGDGTVRRVLPYSARRMVGPFIFVDRMGPESVDAGTGLDIDAHPHIGLSTITYLFEGSLVHRDSTGAVQRIDPGGVNWMTAGRGVTHTERSPQDERDRPSRLSGVQTWVALPTGAEDGAPSFQHLDAVGVPAESRPGVEVRVVVGTGWGLESPVTPSSPLLLADVALTDGTLHLPTEHRELAVLAVEGEVSVDGRPLPDAHLSVHDRPAGLELSGRGRVVVLGGEPVGRRHIWWNFVSSDPDRIEAARRDWAEQRFPLVPGDSDPWVPLPD